jgi:adenosylmethionine-8-amino-7-oxononanoate aminotransferase
MPLAATLATERIYEGFLGAHEDFRTFFHGHTYTGNPLACAAALATLDIFEEESTLDRLAPKIDLLGRLLDEHVRPLRSVAEIRRCGFIVGIELTGFAPADRMGHQVTLAARRRGAVVRPLGDVIVLMAPLAITPDELGRLVEITAAAIAEATGQRLPEAAGPALAGLPPAAVFATRV